MPDLSRLEALIARLAEIDFSQSSEQDTREIAVNTVIRELGWDTLDRDEVSREYSVRGGRVDYCLRNQARDLVLIEVKRAGTDLTEHQEQLLRYAFDQGASMAALTDGLVWWLYLPMEKVSWEQRRFARVSFREQQSADAAAALYRFLNRNGVTGGEAHKEAKREFESQERDRRVRAALQNAWEKVLGDPDSLLREELSDTVEEISGYPPDRQMIADFLQGVLGTRNSGPQVSQRGLPLVLGDEVALRPDSKKQAASEADAAAAAAKPGRKRTKRGSGVNFEPNGVTPKMRDGTKQAALRDALRYGATLDDLSAVTTKANGEPWPPSAVISALHYDVRKHGYGVRTTFDSGDADKPRYWLIEPNGACNAPTDASNAVETSIGESWRKGGGNRRLVGFRLDGTYHEEANSRRMLLRICEMLAQQFGPVFVERASKLRGREKPLFSSSPEELRDPLRISGTPLYVEGNIDSPRAERIARQTLQEVRGSDGGFRVDRAESPQSS